jgi:PEP-CTERM motif
MKNKKIVSLAALFIASLATAHAQTLTGWTFDNDGVGANASPAPSTGFGTATALGMSNSFNNTNSISNPDILASAGSSTSSLPDAWRIRGAGAVPSAGNGWSSQAAIGTQGAEFDVNTLGFNNIKITFDVDTTAQAERNLELEYTLDGTTWLNATLTSGGTLGTLENNSTSGNTVIGSYVELGSGWNNQITADLTDVTGANNDADFGIRIVDASTGADDVNVSGAAYNNSSGNWRVDNVDVDAVPEPSALALAGLGLTGLFIFRKRSVKA